MHMYKLVKMHACIRAAVKSAYACTYINKYKCQENIDFTPKKSLYCPRLESNQGAF